LDSPDAEALLTRGGISVAEAQRINRFARGHPLALTLALASRGDGYGPDPEVGGGQRVVEELTRLYLSDVREPLTREALEAVSVVRRGTRSLLRAMLPHAAPVDAFERLLALPFVGTHRDGLRVHDAVQQAIAATLRAADPDRYSRYRRSAWRQLQTESHTAGGPDLWRYTADLLYLVENPVIREAFFPSDAQLLAVEPTRPDDEPVFSAICARHGGEQAARSLGAWWASQPEAVFAVRDRDGQMVGFYCMADASTLSPEILRADPIAHAWAQHVRRHPLAPGQHTLFYRRWLSLEHGESPSAIQAACWLDAKRAYMELRPALQRVYTTVCELSVYAPTIQRLGFRVVPECQVDLDGQRYATGVLDFGPGSVDGWLAGLVATELGVDEEPRLLDVDAHELILGERRVGLTRLEFAVMQYLHRHAGKAVSRTVLLENVWGYSYDGGSNVVDVVVRGLRKKLEDRAQVIETVSGVGYRLRLSAEPDLVHAPRPAGATRTPTAPRRRI
jgi:DNA-binding winged helix-turn-helix (wHTH) protein